MKILQPLKKIVSITFVFLIFITTNSVIAQGPTAPEAASFEPVDAKDMVNLITGDLTYTLPLLNVPSPEGGYPISLAYHAGIAMDQEASWVGLGWSLNPGALNRSVNGSPDDWSATKTNEFFYDEGWTEDYYGVTVGGTLPNGVYIGVAGSWGSNKSFGGTVTLGYGSIRGTIGTKGEGGGFSFGYGGVSGSVNTNGFNFGISYGYGAVSGGLNYSSNDGLGVGIGITGGPKKGKYGPSFSTGVSFNSNGVSNGGFISASGGGRQMGSSEQGTAKINTKSFGIDIGIFNVGYSHTQVRYSLFSHKNLNTSGILYPYSNKGNINEGYYDTINTSFISSSLHFMDVYKLSNDDYRGHTLYPNYDNYSVNAQGLSGEIKPRLFKNMNLFGRPQLNGASFVNNTYTYSERFLTANENTIEDSKYNIGGEKESYFYFENALNSFLRIQTGNAYKLNDFSNFTDFNIFNNVVDEADATYSSALTPEGYLKKNGSRKREGNFIEIFTNEQIKNNQVSGVFIEATGINRNSDDVFLDEGIGAYRITSLDGKTYHYSLPVYQFEKIFRNYNNNEATTVTNVNTKFFESKQYKQYATHWLLTAVTGPDYIDINNNGKLDEDDYGYWVEFGYGKWSDGYTWRTPKTGYHNIKTFDHTADDTKDRYGHSFTMGRKQVYYLDAIKTRTHTALFVKEIRDDSESPEIHVWSQQANYQTNNFNEAVHSHTHVSNTMSAFYDPRRPATFFAANGTNYNLPSYVSCGAGCSLPIGNWHAKPRDIRYIDIPKNKTLGLKNIHIVKNENLNIDKTSGEIITRTKGYTSFNTKYSYISQYNSTGGVGWSGPDLYEKPLSQLTSFDIHQHENVLDIDDVQNIDLNLISEQVIGFNYAQNSLLGQQSTNSSAHNNGRLTLNSISMKGKQGIQLVPDYKFEYHNRNTSFDKDKIDNWGFNVDDPATWSLSQIETPLGSKIDIEYESDSFYTEAAYTDPDFERVDVYKYHGLDLYNFQNGNNPSYDHAIESYVKDGDFITFYFKNGALLNDLDTNYSIGQEVSLSYDRYFKNLNVPVPSRFETVTGDSYTIYEMSSNQWIKIKVNSETYLHDDFPDSNTNCYDYPNTSSSVGLTHGVTCTRGISLKIVTGGYTFDNPNGKLGGGLRVKNISLLEGSKVYKTNYEYTNPIHGNISGITSYFPSDEYPIKKINFAELLPSPSVMYEYVTVSSINNNVSNGKTRYKFTVLESSENENSYSEPLFGNQLYKNSDGIIENTWSGGYNNLDIINSKKLSIMNNISQIGRVESVKTYNEEEQLINCIINNYKTDLDDDGQIGVTQETFNDITQTRGFYESPNPNNIPILRKVNRYTSTSIVNYPNILESTISLSGGYKNKTDFTKHDFLTGQVLETTTEDSKGNIFKTEVIPAYHISTYNNAYGMGAKTDNSINKNMLTQEAMNKSYIDVNGSWKEIGTSITTWNNDWTYVDESGGLSTPTSNGFGLPLKVWRKHKSYTWDGDINTDGTYQGFVGDDDDFNWGIGQNTQQSNPKWKNISTITLYDHYSMPLEVEDINNNHTTTKMCDEDTKVSLSSNARYGEAFYSGAEFSNPDPLFLNYLDQGIEGSTFRTNEYAHTGKYALKIDGPSQIQKFQTGFKTTLWQGQHDAGKYKISVWVKKDNASNARIHLNGATKPFNGETVTAGDWVMLNHYEDLQASNETIFVTSVSGIVYFDDFRLHPIASTMTSYVYNKWDELEAILGSNNLATKFEYDSQGRLIATYTEVIDAGSITGGFKKASENFYNYKNQ